MEEFVPEIEEEWKRRWDNKTINEDWENKDKWTKILLKEMTRLKWRVFLTMRCFTSRQKDKKIAKKFKKIVLLYMYLHSASLDEKKKFLESSVKWLPNRMVHLVKWQFCEYSDYWIQPEDFTILRTCIAKALKSERDKMRSAINYY